MRRLIQAIALALTLSACVHTQYEMQQKAMDEARNQAKEFQLKCKQDKIKGKLKTYSAVHACSKDRIINAYQSANYQHMDIVNQVAAYDGVLAERQDNKEITEVQAELLRQEYIASLNQIIDQRNAMIDAQESSRRAQNNAAMWQGYNMMFPQPAAPAYSPRQCVGQWRNGKYVENCW